jgi:hypothetical protein
MLRLFLRSFETIMNTVCKSSYTNIMYIMYFIDTMYIS